MAHPSVHVVGLSPAVDEVVELGRLRPGAHHRGVLSGRRAAGKATNVACTLARLGVSCTLHGCVGRGELPLFQARLGAARVRSALFGVDAVTRRSTTVLSGRQETHLTYASFPVGRSTFATVERRLVAAVREGDLVVMAGSPPPGSSLAGLRQLFAAARRAGALWYVDVSGAILRTLVSLRPDGIRLNEHELLEWHQTAARTEAGKPSARQPTDAVSPFWSEPGAVEGRLTPRLGAKRAAEIAPALAELVHRRPGRVMLSFGPRGALLATSAALLVAHARTTSPEQAPASGRGGGGAGGTARANGPGGQGAARIAAHRPAAQARRHTVGAGDAQLAGWVWAMLSGSPTHSTELRDAVAVATAKLRHPLPGTVRMRDVRALRQAIVVREI